MRETGRTGDRAKSRTWSDSTRNGRHSRKLDEVGRIKIIHPTSIAKCQRPLGAVERDQTIGNVIRERRECAPGDRTQKSVEAGTGWGRCEWSL